MVEPSRDELEAALRKIVGAHKTMLAAVTPGHPQRRLRDKAGYDKTFSGWHRATDEAAALLGWDHRQEVADEAGTTNGIK
jgi:hypothetical protein